MNDLSRVTQKLSSQVFTHSVNMCDPERSLIFLDAEIMGEQKPSPCVYGPYMLMMKWILDTVHWMSTSPVEQSMKGVEGGMEWEGVCGNIVQNDNILPEMSEVRPRLCR